MKTSRKLLSMLLVVAMCFSLMAVSAFAENNTGAMAARGEGIDDGSAVAIEEVLGLGEEPDAFSIAGIVLILGCVILLEQNEMRRDKAIKPKPTENS